MARIMRSFSIGEISAVDNPAQVHAKATIMKRREPATIASRIAKLSNVAGAIASIAKDYSDTADAEPKSFADILAENEAQRAKWAADEELWPLFSALQESIRNACANASMDTAAKMDMIRQNVEDFLNAVASTVPAVETELEKALLKAGSPGNTDKTGDPKMSAELEKKLGELRKQLDETTAASALIATENAVLKRFQAMTKVDRDFHDSLPEAERTAFVAGDDTVRKAMIEKRAGDETLTVEGQTIRKSDNPTFFAIVKGQQARINANEESLAKRTEELEIETFGKAADEMYKRLPGDRVVKAKALRAISKIGSKEDREAIETMLKSGAAALKQTFNPLGEDGGNDGDTPDDKLDKMAKAYAVEHKVNFSKAYAEVLKTEAGAELYSESRDERIQRAAGVN